MPYRTFWQSVWEILVIGFWFIFSMAWIYLFAGVLLFIDIFIKQWNTPDYPSDEIQDGEGWTKKDREEYAKNPEQWKKNHPFKE